MEYHLQAFTNHAVAADAGKTGIRTQFSYRGHQPGPVQVRRCLAGGQEQMRSLQRQTPRSLASTNSVRRDTRTSPGHLLRTISSDSFMGRSVVNNSV